jgi:DNA-binding IclR family transcriptional regulator
LASAFSSVDEVLRLLRDGEWHTLEEIMQKTGLHEFRMGLIVDFLAKYNFVVVDEAHKRMRLVPLLVNFLKDIEALENRKADV